MLKAIGFDLFNTLMVVHPNALNVALGRVVDSLIESGLDLDPIRFLDLHNKQAINHIKAAQALGKETHNSLWIAAALNEMGFHVGPQDIVVRKAVEDYFSAFYELSYVIPGTHLMLEELKPRYKLALVSNFTHYPACQRILERLGLLHYFDVCIISGQLGLRKPHKIVFDLMLSHLGVQRDEMIFVGDDPDADIRGATNAGIRAVWTSYVLDQGIQLAPGYLRYKVDPDSIPAHKISNWQELRALIRYMEEGLG